MKKLFGEFKSFIMRGNVLDMAVGVIIAGAFNTIVTTLNQKILMPLVNLGLSNIPGMQSSLVTILPNSQVVAESTPGAVIGPDGLYYATLNYIDWSAFIESILNFFFIALTLFILLKIFVSLSNARKKLEDELKKKSSEEVTPETPVVENVVEPTPDPVVVLLEEIRDSLKNDTTPKIKKVNTKEN